MLHRVIIGQRRNGVFVLEGGHTMIQMTILVGTVGQGIMRSPDGGETWGRVGIGQGMHSDAIVRALLPDPGRP